MPRSVSQGAKLNLNQVHAHKKTRLKRAFLFELSKRINPLAARAVFPPLLGACSSHRCDERESQFYATLC